MYFLFLSGSNEQILFLTQRGSCQQISFWFFLLLWDSLSGISHHPASSPLNNFLDFWLALHELEGCWQAKVMLRYRGVRACYPQLGSITLVE